MKPALAEMMIDPSAAAIHTVWQKNRQVVSSTNAKSTTATAHASESSSRSQASTASPRGA